MKNKSLIIGGIVLSLVIIISISTYAFWTITKSQDGSNDIVAACLDIDMESVDGTFGLNPAWPISDNEGMDLTGYTFKVTNNCEEDVSYIIGMDSLETSGSYLSYDSIKVSLDNNNPEVFGKINDPIEHIETNDPYTIRESQKLNTAIVNGKVGDTPGENTHNVKVWISSDAPVKEQGKIFSGRVFIIGGQKIDNDKPALQATSEACFEMDGEEIIDYREELEECGENVVIPSTVAGVSVKTIDSNAFKEEGLVPVYYDDDIDNAGQTITPVSEIDFARANVMFIFDNYQENTGLDLSQQGIIANSTYIVKLTPDAPVNTTIDGAAQEYGITAKIKNHNEIPGLGENQIAVYANFDATFVGHTLGAKYLKLGREISINELDLSRALNLESIEDGAFSNVPINIVDHNILYNNYPISLTALNFGSNDNEISIGRGAFARIDVDKLTLYTSYNQNNEFKSELRPFGGSTIDDLTIKASSNNSELKSYILSNVNVGNLNIAEGITSIDDLNGNQSAISQFRGTKIGTLILPKTLKSLITGINLGCNRDVYNVNDVSEIDELIVNSPITEVAASAFEYATIKKIKLPDTVETIGVSAFARSRIENIKFSKKLRIISKEAFNCSGLKGDLIIPASVVSIGESAFNYTNISSLEIEDTPSNPSNLKIIGRGAFSSSNKLIGKLILPNSLEEIGEYAFSASALSEVIIPSSIITIPVGAFSICRELSKITIPYSVTEIGQSAFINCANLTELIIEDTPENPSLLTTIGISAFNWTGLTNVVIPKSVVRIEEDAFGSMPEEGTIILKGTPDNPDMFRGTNWNGKASFIYQ